jgi:hypothetical protein
MRLIAIAIACLIGGTAMPLRAAPINDLPAPITTRQTVFSIPYTVPSVQPQQQPSEVRLLASADRGATWQVTDRMDLRLQQFPYKGAFNFRAPADGEYWFAIRTVDGLGQMAADKDGLPELRVVVDTRPPRLDFSASQGVSGEIVAHWQAIDPALRADSLRLYYQSTANHQWQPIAVDPPSGADRSVSASSATWWPADASGTVTVKAEISDAAGNVAAAQAQVDLRAAQKPVDSVARDVRTVPTASRGPSAGVPHRPSESSPIANRPASSATQRPAEGGARPPVGFSGAIPWPADLQTDLPLGRRSAASQSNGGNHPQSLRDEEIGPISGPSLAPPTEEIGRPGQPAMAEPLVHPPVGNRYVSPPSTAAPNAPGAGMADSNEPAAEQIRMVNSTTFDLDYELESIGRTGIAKVELWLTRDRGQHWESAGVDIDNRSPFRTTVDREGIYGYRLTVESGSGLAGQPPQPGELPDVWIGVDLKRPNARLLSAEPGSGDHVGELLIRFEAADARLANRPITLLQSTQAGGPWTIIAAGIPNVGQFAWRFDETASSPIYLRLEARDEAGNVGAYESPEPVVLQRVVPQGRLRSVRPVGESARLPSARTVWNGAPAAGPR